jgi:glycosyltransferase involved in cell wall biosynthesis
MKILFITHYSDLYGGNKSLINLIDGLTSMYDIEPLVVIPIEGTISSVLKDKNIPYIVMKFNQWCEVKPKMQLQHLYRYIMYKYFSSKRIKKLNTFNEQQICLLNDELGNFKPEWVYSNSSVFNFGILYAKKYNIKHIWHIREFGKKDYNLKFFDKKKVTDLFNTSDKVIGISNAIKSFYNKKYDIRNIIVEYNAVLSSSDLEIIDKRVEKKIVVQFTDIVFGIVGLIQINKRQVDAIAAFKVVNNKYPNTKLIIAGMGDQEELKKMVNRLKLSSKVEFLGHLSDPFDAFLKMDINLMCSKNEGLGRVTIEAMAASIPTIGYKGGGTIEIIQNNITGLFYENGINDLSNKMIYLIENESKRYEMGFNARKIFEKKYTNEVYAKKMFEIITDTSQK